MKNFEILFQPQRFRFNSIINLKNFISIFRFLIWFGTILKYLKEEM